MWFFLFFSWGASFGYGLWNYTNKKKFHISKFHLLSQFIRWIKNVFNYVSYQLPPLCISLPTSNFYYFHKQHKLFWVTNSWITVWYDWQITLSFKLVMIKGSFLIIMYMKKYMLGEFNFLNGSWNFERLVPDSWLKKDTLSSLTTTKKSSQ